MADQNVDLKGLGLKKNKITAISGNLIAAALKDNVTLKMIDLSWNKLGVKPFNKIDKKSRRQIKGMSAGDVGRAWGACFIDNKTLIHVDLSFNEINEADTIAFSQDF